MSDATPAGRTPDFLIIGEAKCGTTSLWEILSRNPRVFFPAEKELHFFASYNAWPEYGRLETTGLGPYFEQFAAAAADQLCGEATPNYLSDASACERIERTLPHARFVVILRDPVQRAWSQYWHQVRRGRERLNFEEALEAEDARLASSDPDDHVHFSYASRGHYIESLRRYEQRFGREQLCVVLLEDLKRDPKPVIEQVYAHIGLAAPSEDEQWTLSHANKADFPRWPKLDQFTRRVRRWAENEHALLLKPIRAIGRMTQPLRVYSGQPRMDESTAGTLRRRFASSDRELAAWLGREPPWRDAD